MSPFRMVHSLFLFAVTVLLFGASACAPHALAPTEAAARYHPVRLASGVPTLPGSIAWSPDGKSIAWTGKQLTVYDRESGKKTLFPLKNPYFLAWSPDGLLYALSHGTKEEKLLSSLDVPRSRVTVLSAVDADAVYAAPDAKSLVLTSAQIVPLSMGTQVNWLVSAYSIDSKNSRTVYQLSRTAMTRNPDIALWTAWLHAGISPLDLALIVMEHVSPPLIAGYTVVNTLDLATGEVSPLTNAGSRKRYTSGSWSPDGRRVVLTDGDGRLEVRSRSGESKVLDPSVSGRYPSWNPRGSSIYAGGFLIDSQGANREQLLASAPESIGTWSPDGTMLAVAGKEELLLFTGIRTAFIPPDRPGNRSSAERFSLLRELVLNGSITREEYRERWSRLMEKTGEAE